MHQLQNTLKVDHLLFTQEVKDAWISALESGKFKQGYKSLRTTLGSDENNEYCYCALGVLNCIHHKLSDDLSDNASAYTFFEDHNEFVNIDRVVDQNDNSETFNKVVDQHDYHRVLKLIRTLPVVENY